MAKATRDGKIVGFVRWITPKDADTHAEQKAGNATSIWSQDGHYPPGSEVNLARELLEVHEKEILEPHFRIGLLAVDPEAQGARVGSALLRHVCRQADEHGVAVYLRASPEALSLYQRFGFRQHGEPHCAASDPELALYPMLRRPIGLVPATVRDLAVLAPIHHRAFAPTAATRYIYANVVPAPAVQEAYFHLCFGYVLASAQARRDGGSVMTVARQGNQTLGFAWSTREPGAQSQGPAANNQPLPGPNIPGADPIRGREFYGTLQQYSHSIPFAHWNLQTISVDPAVQGAGVGKRLLRSVMEKAASEGLPVMLESEEEKLALYQTAGFEICGEALVAAQDSTVKQWPMMLKTQKASESAQS